VVEGGAVGEEVVDLAGLHVVGEPRDEEREHALPLRVRVRRIHVVGVHRRRRRVGETMGEAHLRRAATEEAASTRHGRGRGRRACSLFLFCSVHCCRPGLLAELPSAPGRCACRFEPQLLRVVLESGKKGFVSVFFS